MKLHKWADIEREQMNPTFARQVLHGNSVTLAKVFLTKGAMVPRHQHVNEQITVMQTGKLRFVFDNGEQIVEAGQVLQISANEPHAVEALEDSFAYDLFVPCRQDWIEGDDSYLRG